MYRDAEIPIRTLIVEDDTLYKTVLYEYFQNDQEIMIIDDAGDGQTAISLVKEHRPDVVIMDLGLPFMSGLDAIKRIKDIRPDIKIVVLTAHTDVEEAIESVAAGATAYVNKDIEPDNLKMIIETVNRGAVWLSPLIGRRILEEGVKCCKKEY